MYHLQHTIYLYALLLLLLVVATIQTGDLKLTKNGFCFYVNLAPDGKISKSIGRLWEKHMVINFINFF